uniref:peptidylprolyl isomerase n=1 Tax=Globodera pallida TaxID=36090 RepID=A0A183CJ18_GLOPA
MPTFVPIRCSLPFFAFKNQKQILQNKMATAEGVIDLSKEKDGGIVKRILRDGGEQGVHPAKGDTVYVHYVGTLKDTGEKFDSSRDRNEPFSFTLGKGQVIKGWDVGVASMCRGELAQLECRADYAYGEAGSPPKIPGGATLLFDVKASWELLDEEKLEHALKLKERGTEFLNQGKHKLALAKYQAVISLLEFAKPTKSDDDEAGKALKAKFEQAFIAALLNSALVNLRMCESAEAIKSCDKVLEKQPNNVKALYRKAQALQNRKDFEEAIEQYQHVQQLEPSNSAAVQQIVECRQRLAAQREAERNKYRAMFDRMAKEKEEVGASGGGDAAGDVPNAGGQRKEATP